MSTSTQIQKYSPLKTLRLKAFQQQQGRCWYCGLPMWFHSPDELPGLPSTLAKHVQCTAEHLTARCDGGADTADNIVAACARCNHTRHKLSVPPQPLQYKGIVQKSMANGHWHRQSVLKICRASLLRQPASWFPSNLATQMHT